MINTKKFYNLLKKNINFFSGVPDSCMNEFCNELSNHKNITNLVAANEDVLFHLVLVSFSNIENTMYIYAKFRSW